MMRIILILAVCGVLASAQRNTCPTFVSSYLPTYRCNVTSGKCQSASCSGNNFNRNGHENECVVNRNKLNAGGQCPWANQAYGISCNYISGCQLGRNNNCLGYTACAVGDCPQTALNYFCLESGNSDNFKICGCDDTNCQVSEWSAWGPCNNNQQTRSRTVITSPSGNGQTCPTLTDTQSCVPDTDCVVSAWSDWTPCNNNVQTRTRGVVIIPSGTGVICPALTQSQSCGNECNGVIVTKADFYVAYFNKHVTGNVIANDVGTQSVELIPQTSRGSFVLNANGSFVYRPERDYCGTETFLYKAIKGNCFAQEQVVITTTCGCGSLVETVTCTLDLTQSTTQCSLPGGRVVVVPNLPTYRTVVINLNAKFTYRRN